MTDAQIITFVVSAIIVLGLTIVFRALKNIDNIDIVIKEISQKKDLVQTAVLFVEKAYSELGGPQKKEKAISWLTSQFQKYGFDVDVTEISAMIEEIVITFNREFGKNWEYLKDTIEKDTE